MISWILVFILTFLFMEFTAWFLHKYVMHGFLWSLHYDHHTPSKNKIFQKNDFFSIFFAFPSFFSILFGTKLELPLLASFGYGIMFYGFAYTIVHEGIIHKRFKIPVPQNWYIKALLLAHQDHHKVNTKDEANNFGMLIVAPKYFIETIKNH